MGQQHSTAVDDRDHVPAPTAIASVPPHDLALLTSPEVYRTVARQSAVAMFLVAPDGRFVVANPAACDLFGRSEEQLLSLSLTDVSHPDDLEWSGAQLSRAIDEGMSAYRIHKRYLRGDGTAVTADVTVSLLRDEHGHPLGFFASAVDDTERLEAARRADAASELFRASMDSLLDPWVLLRSVRDADGTVTDFEYVEANKEACRHNAMTHGELIGRRLLDLLPGHRGQLLADYARVLETGEPLIDDDLPFVTGGETRWFDNRAVKVGDDDLSFTWRDVTDNHVLRGDLARRATTDPLTGLYNRAGLAEAVARMSGPERRNGPAGMAALYLDLDGLNTINNRYGHPAGDAVIRAVGDRIAGALRATDVVARVGGDEFVVLAPGVSDGVADALAVKIAQAVTRPVRVEGTAIVPTISVGVCVGSDDVGIDELIARADASLLERKRRLYDAPDVGA
jgi:diguanylate cyclase (GGDEF)-like protein/PAS domain S-box-containing protein